MSVKAILHAGHHQVQMTPYTPDSAVEGGDIVIDNDVPVVFHRPYDPEDGSAPICPEAAVEGGIYKIDKDGTSGPTFAFGDPVYINDTTGATTSSGDTHFGMCTEDAGTNQAWVYATHRPNIGTASS